MKQKLAFASLLVLSACGTSAETRQALVQMNILENNPDAPVSYASQSGSGNDVTLRNVELRAPASFAGMLGAPQRSAVQIDTPVPPPEVVTDDEDVIEDESDGADASDSEDEDELSQAEISQALRDAFAEATDEPPPGPVTVARAETLTFRGLTLKDGKPVARDIIATNLTPAQDLGPVKLKLGSLSFEGMNEATGAFIAALVAQDAGAAPPAFEAWGFDKASLGGFTLAAEIPQQQGGTGSVNIALGELSFAGVADRKLALAVLDGVKGDLNVPGMPPVVGTFDLGRMELGDINLKYFADQIGSVMQPLMNPLEPFDYAAMYADMTSPIDGGLDRFDWTGAKVDISGVKFDVSPVHTQATRNEDGVVVALTAPRYTMTLKTDASGGTLGAMGLMGLAMMGYDSDTVELFFQGDASFDPAKDYTRWDNYHVGVTDLADVKLSVGLLGLQKALPNLMQSLSSFTPPMLEEPEEAEGEDGDEGEDGTEDDADDADGEVEEEGDPSGMFAGDPAAMMSLMMGLLPLQLTDLDIEITDAKLVNLIVENQAITAGQSAEDYRADLVAMITASSVFMSDAGVDAAIAQELATAASGFMSGPGTLRIQLKPKTPFGMVTAFSSPITKESLGFTATFTPTPPAVEPPPAAN